MVFFWNGLIKISKSVYVMEQRNDYIGYLRRKKSFQNCGSVQNISKLNDKFAFYKLELNSSKNKIIEFRIFYYEVLEAALKICFRIKFQ